MDMTGSKLPFQSLTINASTIALVVSILGSFGFRIAPEAVPHITSVVTGICAALAIYGRWRARKLIT